MISAAGEVTSEWLSAVLRTRVLEIAVHRNQAFNSSVTNLEVTYRGSVTLPRRLLVKLNRDREGQNEIRFYRFAEGMGLPAILQPLAMDYDPHTGLSFLILEDLSNTHGAPVTREQLIELQGVPSREHMHSMVACLAQFHAAFWEHPRFGTVPDTTEMRGWYRSEEFHSWHLERRKQEWARLVGMHSHDLPPEWLELGAAALQKLPMLFNNLILPRLTTGRALTMSQGDCYPSQFLVPQTGPGRAYLIDFQDASVNFPAYDLVYMLATFWTREQRELLEKESLHLYRQELERHGVQYAWEMLEQDYRLSLSYMLFDAVWNAVSGSSPRYWKPKMKCLIDTYQDWDCISL